MGDMTPPWTLPPQSERVSLSRKGGNPCPHCRAPLLTRSSDPVTRTVRSLYVVCTNPDCGLTGRMQLSWVHTINPSLVPDPQVDIPPCPDSYVRRRYPDPGDDPDSNQLLMFPDESG